MSSIHLIALILVCFVHRIETNENERPRINKNCTATYQNQIYAETESIVIGNKFFKVEDCQVQRAYQACGAPLWFMMHIVCGTVEKQKKTRQNKHRLPRFTQEKLLTDSCCIHLCTINEMTRYCPT